MPTYEAPDAMRLVRPDPVTGQQRRFVCKCGMKSLDPADGIMHAFAELEDNTRHAVHEERFSVGLWHYDRQSVATKILERMRRKGESFNDFTRRIITQLTTATAELERLEGVKNG